MLQRWLVILQVSAMAVVVCSSAAAFAGPPKPSSPRKCSVSAVGDTGESAADVALFGLGLVGVAAARRRVRVMKP